MCNGYMCNLLYMKLIWCNDFPEIYGQLEDGEVYVHATICHMHEIQDKEKMI